MGAGEVAQGAGELKPEVVEALEVDPGGEVLGGRHLDERKGVGEGVGHLDWPQRRKERKGRLRMVTRVRPVLFLPSAPP